MTKLQAAKALQRLKVIEAKCKDLYDERDAIETRLIEAVRASKTEAVALPDGAKITLKDNFQDRDGNPSNVAFKTAAIKRFQIQVK
jgi:hypothetical protein